MVTTRVQSEQKNNTIFDFKIYFEVKKYFDSWFKHRNVEMFYIY